MSLQVWMFSLLGLTGVCVAAAHIFMWIDTKRSYRWPLWPLYTMMLVASLAFVAAMVLGGAA